MIEKKTNGNMRDKIYGDSCRLCHLKKEVVVTSTVFINHGNLTTFSLRNIIICDTYHEHLQILLFNFNYYCIYYILLACHSNYIGPYFIKYEYLF